MQQKVKFKLELDDLSKYSRIPQITNPVGDVLTLIIAQLFTALSGLCGDVPLRNYPLT